ncbi:MAG TPA: hypothetical protein VFE25_09580 [Opitutaceae bacterium]|nr:hypothetical protein [Opitutaceae bacterium]
MNRILAVGLLCLTIAPAGLADETAAKTAKAQKENAYRMQRFIVSAARVDKPWHYASMPGFEVLTRASKETTYAMLDSLQRGLWLQNDVMPKEWLPNPVVPYTVIIDDTDLTKVPLGQPHSNEIVLEAPADADSWGPLANKALIWSDQLPAHDADTLAFSTNVFGIEVENMTYGSVSMERLGRCAPPLPKWVIAGLIGQKSGVFREGFVPYVSKGLFGPGWIHKATGPGTIWVSMEETKRMAQQSTFTVPPLGELFSEAPPRADAIGPWESEAALLVRWALLGPGKDNVDQSNAFRELVRRARKEPITEKVFRECFGYGYDKMESDLALFLKTTIGKPMLVDLDMPSNFPKPVLYQATADQVGRILGDWLRMEGDSLKERDPDMSRESLYYAGRTVLRAYREDNGLIHHMDPAAPDQPSPTPAPAGSPTTALDLSAAKIHDPRLLTVLGLYARDVGSNKKAREFLAAGTEAKVVRPRAYFVLSELLLKRALAKPDGAEGRISAAQGQSALVPLRLALKSGATAEIYRLMVDIWANGDARPTEADAEELASGAELFPRDTELAYNTALICAKGGQAKVAARLIDKAVEFAVSQENRQHFEVLRATMDLPEDSAGK